MTTTAPRDASRSPLTRRRSWLLTVLDVCCFVVGVVWIVLAVGVGPVSSITWFLPYVTPIVTALLLTDWVWRTRRSGGSWLRVAWFVPVCAAITVVAYVNPGNFTVIGSLPFVGPVAVVVACVVVAVALGGAADRATNQAARWLGVAASLVLLTVAALGSLVLLYGEGRQDAGPVSEVLGTYGPFLVEIDKTPADARADSVFIRTGTGPFRHETWLCAVDDDLNAQVGEYAVVLTNPYTQSERTIWFDTVTVAVIRDTGGRADRYYCS